MRSDTVSQTSPSEVVYHEDGTWTVGGVYHCDKYGRTTGYIRKLVTDKLFGFIAPTYQDSLQNKSQPTDVFFLFEYASASMILVRGAFVSFRLVQVEVNAKNTASVLNRAVDIVPLIENPKITIAVSSYKAMRPAGIVPQLPMAEKLPFTNI